MTDKLIPLSEMKKNQQGTIVELKTADNNIIKKLMSMGILPGVVVKVIQNFPSYIFQAGFTQVAVDKEIASVIMTKV